MSQSSRDSEIEIVKPIVKAKDALSEIRVFEELKSKLLSESDYQNISGKNFIKKSGWRKLALVFNISDQVVENSRRDRPDGSFVCFFRVRAIAPNGRFSEAVGSCDSKERRFAHLEHDIFATAHTRSKSRAISDLIGAGEISAEEMEAPINSSSSEVESELNEPELESARSLLRTANSIFKNGSHEEVQTFSESSNSQNEGSSLSRFDLN